MIGRPAVRVLGPVRVRTAAGAEVPPPGALPTRLVAALALAGRDGRASAALVEDIWPDREPRSPRAALQMLVSRTRAVAADGTLESTATGYRIADSDLVLAERADRADAGEALALWTGEPAAELEPSPLADELAARAGRARRRLLALEGDRLLDADRAAEALPVLEERARLDPLDGGAARSLMRALAGSGAVDRALDAFARHRAALADALGTDPAPETAALNADLLRAADRRPAELVGVRAAATPLLGRDRDVAALVAAVRTRRLTSIVGTGGLGKTRLAHEVAARLADRFDRIVVAELAGAQTADDVPLVVGAAAGARPAQARRLNDPLPIDLATRTREALAGPRTLLVLDNCEHVVDTVAGLTADLLAAVPTLTVLTTSRVPLLLAGEQVVAPEPLAAAGAASRLFVDRATAARPGVLLDPALVERVCARLDGLPLAIELAAARLRTMGLPELDRRLDDRFAVLVGGDRTAPERHRTLLAVIDWSRRLLTPAASAALGPLAQFPDGCTAESAGAVLATEPSAILTELVDHSLLGFEEAPGATGRFRMLETVREFGLRDLAESGRLAAARRAMDRWAVGFCRSTATGLLLGRDDSAGRAVAAEEDTLLAVLRADPAGRGPVVLAAFGTLAEHWVYRGDFEAVLDAAPLALAGAVRRPASALERDDAVRALVLLSSIAVAIRDPRTARALALLRRALAAGPRGDRFWEVIGRDLLLVRDLRDLDAAVDGLAGSADPVVGATGLGIRAQLLENRGELAEALAALQRVERLAERQGLRWLQVFGRMSAISLHSQRGEHRLALDGALALRDGFADLGTPFNLQQLDWMTATDETALGLLDDAAERFERVRAATERGVAPEAVDTHAVALVGLAEVATARGDRPAAGSAWDRALVALRRASWPWRALGGAASLAARVELGEPPASLVTDYRRLRSLLLALARIDPARMDRPVFGGGLVGIAAVLKTEGSATAEELIALAAAAGGRRDFASIDRVLAGATPAAGGSADAVERAIALLRSPALRRDD